MRSVVLLFAVVVAAAFAGHTAAHGVLSKLEDTARRGLRSVEASVGNLPLCGSLAGSSAVVAFTFASEAACENYAANRVFGGSTGGTWSNCTSATYCTAFTYAVAGTVVGHPVIGVSMFNIGSGSFTFDSATTTKIVMQSFSNSYLPPTVQASGHAITMAGDCDNTFGSFSLPSAPASNTSIVAFNFASC